MKKTEMIRAFLAQKAHPDLAGMYSLAMECQVNVAQDGGELEQGVSQATGKHWKAWRNPDDPLEPIWKSFRIPFHANAEPEYTDSEIKFHFEKHVEGIGLSGWDWINRCSKWVAFDFDAITGHSDKHQAKMSDQMLNHVQEAARNIPWVTVRKSTSGNGLHLYVFLANVPTANHTEHAALARAILGQMSAMTGFDFNAKVDNCGGNMWVWHRKYEKSNGEGLKLIKQGSILESPPPNWRDHVKVATYARKKSTPEFVTQEDWFEDLCGQNTKVNLDVEHKRLIDFLDQIGALWWWDADHHMLVCHTADLRTAHEKLEMRGMFHTNASGKERGTDQNCFCFPMRKGAWVVRRHTLGVQEHESWDIDKAGWTRTYLNRLPSLEISARSHGGNFDGESNRYVFNSAKAAAQSAEALGAKFDLPETFAGRAATLKPTKDGNVVLKMERHTGDDNLTAKGWIESKDGTTWSKTSKLNTSLAAEEIGNYDDFCRHLITEAGLDAGWAVKNQEWITEPLPHVKLVLAANGIPSKEIPLVMGGSIMRAWKLVNYPFQPEYPGDRLWNKNAAKLSVDPNPDHDNLNYPTWKMVLGHLGKSLDSEIKTHAWCQLNGVQNGGDYLQLWIASMIQKPLEPLPYLFLYSEQQDTGKSTLHEAIDLLMTRGVVRADNALISGSGFNGELQNAVLCVVEETDLRQNKTAAYNRIKDWVTGRTISIHMKGLTPYSAPNSTHWIQTANDMMACPTFPNDTRITMLLVEQPEKMIAKRELMTSMMKEAPDFLAAILNMEIPYNNDRLNIPIISTETKKQAQKMHQSELEAFFQDQCFEVPGEMLLVGEVYDRFIEWCEPEVRQKWSRIRMVRQLPMTFPKGRWMKDSGRHYIGNISWKPQNPDMPVKPRLICLGREDKLVFEDGSEQKDLIDG